MSKILYITDHNKSEAKGGCVSDYLNDLTFYGLKELYGDDVIESTSIKHLYKENYNNYNHSRLFNVFSGIWLLDKDNADRNNIEDKIKDKYFDLIIYGSIRRCNDYFNLVTKIYPKDRIILIDGEDDQLIPTLSKGHICFKRELHPSNKFYKNIKPISFSWPTKDFVKPKYNKTQKYGTVIPGLKETYIFKNPKDYFNDYKKSYFGLTTQKKGWDCMRHYEILGNYCLPYFPDLKNCPLDTLSNFPKELILESNDLVNNFDPGKYFSILDEVFAHTKKHLSTKALAQYLINNI